MLKNYRKAKNRGIIPVILAIIIGVICIIALVGLLALIAWLNDLIAGLTGGGDQPFGNSNFGMGNCAVTQTLDSRSIPDGGKGKISLEQHLATTAESFPGGWPSSQNDQIQRHYDLTRFSINCAGCAKQGFTPAEGGGRIGQGNGPKPDPSVEPWIMNMRANFAPGTKILITSPKTSKTVVAVGGYEYGPSASTGNIAGAQPEVLHALGIKHGDQVEIGFAQDQSLSPGPVTCVDPNTLAAMGPCSQRIVSIARNELGTRGTKCQGSRQHDIQKYCPGCTAWCACFATWVYKQAGYMNNVVPGTITLLDDYKSQLTVISPQGNPALVHPGDIFWVKSNNASGWHVGIVERVAGNKIHTIEGNVTGDVVSPRVKNVGDIKYVARPKNCI